MRTHRLVAAVLLMGMGAFGAPAAQAVEGPSATPVAAASSTTSAPDAPPNAPASPTAAPTVTDAAEPPAESTVTSAPRAQTPTSSAVTDSARAPTLPPVVPEAASATPGRGPTASVGAFDCAALRVTVTLDNSLSSHSTDFSIWASGYARNPSQQSVTVPARQVQQRAVQLVDDAVNQVWVRGPDGTWLASAEAVCGTYTHNPAAEVGVPDCASLTVPVTLDNRHSTDTTDFAVQLDFGRPRSVVVGPGETAVIEFDISGSPAGIVGVFEESGPQGHNQLAGRRARCVASSTTPATSARPTSSAAPAPAVVPTASAPSLASTGTDIALPLMAGAGLVTAGLALLLARRPGRHR